MKNYFKKEMIMCILQIVTIYNAIMLGWSVKKINNNTYELTRQLNGASVDIHDFIEKILKNKLINL